MFDFLSQKFSSLFSHVTRAGKLTSQEIEGTCAQITQSLVEADVPYELVTAFVESVKQEAVGKQVHASLKPGEQFLKIVYEKMMQFMVGSTASAGQPRAELEFSFQIPAVVMVLGLQGSGKTTTVAKLAHFVMRQAQKRGKKRKILVGSVDFYRPAAIDQLQQLCGQISVDFYRAHSADPVRAAAEIYDKYKKGGYELLILDTAGRLHIDTAMMDELVQVAKVLKPHYTFLVLDAMTGQESLTVSRAFEKAVGFDAAILTKMDSDTRGGAAFSFRYALAKPIRFVGVGEKVSDLDLFHPKRAVGRILGMGDLESLFEKAEDLMASTKHETGTTRSGKMTLSDFADQISMIGSLGSLNQVAQYLPGMASAKMPAGALEQSQKEMKRFLAIIRSMTPKERMYPHILDGSRKKRIARGAGATVVEVNLLLTRFEQLQQYAKMFKKQGFLGKLFN